MLQRILKRQRFSICTVQRHAQVSLFIFCFLELRTKSLSFGLLTFENVCLQLFQGFLFFYFAVFLEYVLQRILYFWAFVPVALIGHRVATGTRAPLLSPLPSRTCVSGFCFRSFLVSFLKHRWSEGTRVGSCVCVSVCVRACVCAFVCVCVCVTRGQHLCTHTHTHTHTQTHIQNCVLY